MLQKSGGADYTCRNQQQRPPADRTPLSARAPAMPGPSGIPAPLPQGRPPKVLGPCWHCQEIGHLKVFCPKLHRQQYPLSNVVQSVSVNKLWGELMGSKEKVESYDCIDVPGDNYPVGIIENYEHSETESSLGLEEESNGSSIGLARCWEVEQEGPQITDVQGRLFTNLEFWEKVLEAPLPVIECIKEGYKLPLLSLPEQHMKPNHRSAQQNEEFVTEAVSDLLKNRCIREVEGVPYVCSPLSVVISNSQKKWLVIDLRYLNQHLLQDKFKYEDLRLAMLNV